MLASFEIALTKHNHLHWKDSIWPSNLNETCMCECRVLRMFSSSLVVLALNEFTPIYSMLTSQNVVNSTFVVHRESDLLISLCSSSLILFSGAVS